MSATLENSLDELDPLVGATIEKIWTHAGSVGWDDSDVCLRLRIRYRDGLLVNGKTHGEYELWQDEEGNGAGYIAFVQEG